MAHTVLYLTHLHPSRGDGEPTALHYNDGFKDVCDRFETGFEDGFITFGKSLSDSTMQLVNSTTRHEGQHEIVTENHMQITHCPFCGDEIVYEETERVDIDEDS